MPPKNYGDRRFTIEHASIMLKSRGEIAGEHPHLRHVQGLA